MKEKRCVEKKRVHPNLTQQYTPYSGYTVKMGIFPVKNCREKNQTLGRSRSNILVHEHTESEMIESTTVL